MDEAENCARIAIIDHGKIVAIDTPERLKASIGKDRVQITCWPALQVIHGVGSPVFGSFGVIKRGLAATTRRQRSPSGAEPGR
jgi:hypothetical protein